MEVVMPFWCFLITALFAVLGVVLTAVAVAELFKNEEEKEQK